MQSPTLWTWNNREAGSCLLGRVWGGRGLKHGGLLVRTGQEVYMFGSNRPRDLTLYNQICTLITLSMYAHNTFMGAFRCCIWMLSCYIYMSVCVCVCVLSCFIFAFDCLLYAVLSCFLCRAQQAQWVVFYRPYAMFNGPVFCKPMLCPLGSCFTTPMLCSRAPCVRTPCCVQWIHVWHSLRYVKRTHVSFYFWVEPTDRGRNEQRSSNKNAVRHTGMTPGTVAGSALCAFRYWFKVVF